MHLKDLRLTEPVPISDDLCAGLALIEDLGFGARFVLYANETCYEAGSPVFVVKRKIVLPMAAIEPGLDMTLAWLRTARIAGQGLRLVR